MLEKEEKVAYTRSFSSHAGVCTLHILIRQHFLHSGADALAVTILAFSFLL